MPTFPHSQRDARYAAAVASPQPTPPRQPKFIQLSLPDGSQVAPTLHAGIAADTPFIPPWYLYDDLGSRLFAAITCLPEYYPTRTEAALLQQHLPAIVDAAPVTGSTLIDLGAGNCEKAPQLFPFVTPERYVAVDISVEFLQNALRILQHEHPDIDMLGVGTDFSQRLDLPAEVGPDKRLFFYPGSSIGNFTPEQAEGFLRGVREAMAADGALWIGVDLIKDKDILERAYDDELGVSAAFNLNGLRHVNSLAETDFRASDWRHTARFNTELNRVEMHVEARADLTVSWPGSSRSFRAGERIHTESAYKYTPEMFETLLAKAGLRSAGHWTDDAGWFAFFVALPA